MNRETKEAIKKAFAISKTIFGLGPEKYKQLYKATSSVKVPTERELKHYLDDGLCLEDAFIAELKLRYKSAAVHSGFTERQGLAMLEYAAMLEDLK